MCGSGRDGLGHEVGAFGAGVGVVLGEERRGFFGAEGFEAVGFDVAEFEDRDVLLRGDLANPVVVAHVAFYVGASRTGGLSWWLRSPNRPGQSRCCGWWA